MKSNTSKQYRAAHRLFVLDENVDYKECVTSAFAECVTVSCSVINGKLRTCIMLY